MKRARFVYFHGGVFGMAGTFSEKQKNRNSNS